MPDKRFLEIGNILRKKFLKTEDTRFSAKVLLLSVKYLTIKLIGIKVWIKILIKLNAIKISNNILEK